MSVVIRGGEVVRPKGCYRADVRIEAERVVAVGEVVAQPGDRVLDASGCYVLPGGIDPHTHIEMPAGDLGFTADDWYSGTAAAVAGGTTCVIDMVSQERGGTLRASLEDAGRRAAGRAVCDYSFHAGIIDGRPEVLAEMAEVVASGIPSFKLYLAYKRSMLDDAAAFQVMREAGRLGAWSLVHCENGPVIELLIAEARAAGRLSAGTHGATRPPALEGEATHRAIALAQLAGAPVYIVHVTCREALEAVRKARQAGWQVRAETCSHYLVLTEEEYDRPGFAAAPYVLSPPLRAAEHREALWEGLAKGWLDLVATDHCPWNLKGQKDRGLNDFSAIPNGGPGIEERMAVLWTHGVAAGRWTPEQFVARTSAHAAGIFGLQGKGAVRPGADADIVVWDPTVKRLLSTKTQQSKVDYTLFEGMPVVGQARHVLVRGSLAAQEGRPVPSPGLGRMAHRVPLI